MLSHLAKQDGNQNKAEQYMLQDNSVLLTQNPVYYYIMIRVGQWTFENIWTQRRLKKKALEFQRKVTEYKALLFNQSEAEAIKKNRCSILVWNERAEGTNTQRTCWKSAKAKATVYRIRNYRLVQFLCSVPVISDCGILCKGKNGWQPRKKKPNSKLNN